MAEALMTKHASSAGLHIVASSASVDPDRRVLHPLVIRILDESGVVLGPTWSQPLSKELVDRSDLILTMTGEHAITVAGRFRKAKTKVFMLDHFVRIARARDGDESLDDWLADVQEHSRSYPDHPGAQDVLDPIGKDEATFRAVCGQIDALVARIAQILTTVSS